MFQHLVESLPRRVEAVIAAKGDQPHINAYDFGMRSSRVLPHMHTHILGEIGCRMPCRSCNAIPVISRSASVTNLSLDRSGSSMVPSYDSLVSPQTSRTMPKPDHSEEERKILLVRISFFTFLFPLLLISVSLSLTLSLFTSCPYALPLSILSLRSPSPSCPYALPLHLVLTLSILSLLLTLKHIRRCRRIERCRNRWSPYH